MQQWAGSSLVPIIAHHLLSDEVSPESMMTSYQLDPWKQSSEKPKSNALVSIHEIEFENLQNVRYFLRPQILFSGLKLLWPSDIICW